MVPTKKKVLIELRLSYEIKDNKLKTSVMYPENFLALLDMEKVQLLNSIIEEINNSSFEEWDGETKSIEIAHDELVLECSEIFPFSSTVTFDLTNKEKGIFFEFKHDESIHSLHAMHMVVIADSIVIALKSMAVTIVNRSSL